MTVERYYQDVPECNRIPATLLRRFPIWSTALTSEVRSDRFLSSDSDVRSASAVCETIDKPRLLPLYQVDTRV